MIIQELVTDVGYNLVPQCFFHSCFVATYMVILALSKKEKQSQLYPGHYECLAWENILEILTKTVLWWIDCLLAHTPCPSILEAIKSWWLVIFFFFLNLRKKFEFKSREVCQPGLVDDFTTILSACKGHFEQLWEPRSSQICSDSWALKSDHAVLKLYSDRFSVLHFRVASTSSTLENWI